MLFPNRRLKKFLNAESRDWDKFDRDLDSPRFRKAVEKSKNVDEKLKKYVENYGAYRASTKVVAEVPSKSSGKYYRVKELPNGRLACGCGDWQYRHSTEGTDCKHIEQARSMGLMKKASLEMGVRLGRAFHEAKKERAKGQEAKKLVRTLQSGKTPH